jgi:outer membrane protease
VTYQSKNTRTSELEKSLSNIAVTAASNGWFVPSADATVKTWGWKVFRKGNGNADQQPRKKKPVSR